MAGTAPGAKAIGLRGFMLPGASLPEMELDKLTRILVTRTLKETNKGLR